jgi:hypothetical protein
MTQKSQMYRRGAVIGTLSGKLLVYTEISHKIFDIKWQGHTQHIRYLKENNARHGTINDHIKLIFNKLSPPKKEQ